jgi:hypothetical protein
MMQKAWRKSTGKALRGREQGLHCGAAACLQVRMMPPGRSLFALVGFVLRHAEEEGEDMFA